jgi:hypothetical protein
MAAAGPAVTISAAQSSQCGQRTSKMVIGESHPEFSGSLD